MLSRLTLSSSLLLIAGCSTQPPVAAPTSYASYNSPDGSFLVNYPDGWSAEGNAGRRLAWARFEMGGAKISVRASAEASLLDDAGGGRTADRNAPTPDLAPVHGIHEMGLDGASEEYGSYQETAAGTQVLDCGVGPARFSEFTATGGIGAPIHGYRATAIGHKMGVHVVCTCSESDWTTLKPAFDHVLATLDRGVVE